MELEKSVVPILSAADLHLETAVGSLHRVIRVSPALSLEIDISLVVGKSTISADEYPELRRLLKNCFLPDYLFLLKKAVTD